MRHESMFRGRAGLHSALVLTLLSLALPACVEPESTTCATGLVCPFGQKCAARQAVCIKGDCGDGVIQEGEACDDGNIVDGDGCSRSCESTEGCGNKKVDLAAGEVCDDGNTQSGDGCSADCKSEEDCGNFVVDVGEACDDGNTRDGDGCSADCKFKEGCGNSHIDEKSGEVCDDGNTRSGDGCSADCLSLEQCGNGYRDVGEVCDDGNTKSGDGCSEDCKSTEYCGNGYVDSARGERCDDGNTVDGDSCPSNCMEGAQCRNGIMDPGEECDDGNSWDDDDCRNNCHIAFCGDGIVNMRGRRKEECDDEGESASCNINCTRARCGDGLVNGKAGEQCDDANGEDSDGCISDTCRLARCGDGFIYEGRETCDDGNSLSCGTCDATCLVEQGAERASGTITAVSGNQIRDGEIFSLSDGQTRRVFEFKKQGKAPDSHVTVEVRGNYSPGMVARAIGEAITQAFGDSLTVEPTEREETLVVRVNQPGAHANLPIFESVGDEVFTVEGLHGGAGHDCPDGTGCQSDDDCEHGLLCRAPPGQKKRTCRLPPPPP